MNIRDAVAGWFSSFHPRDGDPAGVEEKRRVWRAIAERRGLAFHPGASRGYFQGDRIEGRLGERFVRISCDAEYDIQKLVVTVSIECDAAIPESHHSRDALVAWYNALARDGSAPPMNPELAPWVAGRRAGIGAHLESRERQLSYSQLYEIDEQTLEFLLPALLHWAHQLELASRARSS